jgi:adenylylsulfate kinase-like enzyme
MRLSVCGGGCGVRTCRTARQSSPGWEIMSRVTTWAVLLTGAPGAGKSSVLERLATLLEIEGVEFGALEQSSLGGVRHGFRASRGWAN